MARRRHLDGCTQRRRRYPIQRWESTRTVVGWEGDRLCRLSESKIRSRPDRTSSLVDGARARHGTTSNYSTVPELATALLPESSVPRPERDSPTRLIVAYDGGGGGAVEAVWVVLVGAAAGGRRQSAAVYLPDAVVKSACRSCGSQQQFIFGTRLSYLNLLSSRRSDLGCREVLREPEWFLGEPPHVPYCDFDVGARRDTPVFVAPKKSFRPLRL